MKSFLVVVTTLLVALLGPVWIAEGFVCVYQTLDSEGVQESHHSICYTLSVPEDPHTALGEVCLTVLDDAGSEVEFSFRATEGRLLTEVKFWISDVLTTPDSDPLEGLPRVEGGDPDLEEGFPFFHEDSAGQEEFRTTIPWQKEAPSCDEHPSGFRVGMVIYARMVEEANSWMYETFAFESEEDREGTTTAAASNGRVFSWVDMIMDCQSHVCSTTVADIPPEHRCHTLESEDHQRAIGEVCVEWEPEQELAEVSFMVYDEFELVTSYFWVGQNVSNIPSETNDQGEVIPSFKVFPNYYCDSKGAEGFAMKSSLADAEEEAAAGGIDCRENDREERSLYVVAQTSFTTSTTLRFFPADAKHSEEAFAYFEVVLRCTCPKQRSSPLTSAGRARMNLSPRSSSSQQQQPPPPHVDSRTTSCQQEDLVRVTKNGGGGGNADYATIPVSVLEVNEDRSEITFAVSQTWEESGWMSWIATLYTNTQRQLVCNRERFVRFDQTKIYTAVCVNGTASVNLYVRHHSYGNSFSAVHHSCLPPDLQDSPPVPMQYVPSAKTAGYTVSLSCRAPQECLSEPYNKEVVDEEEEG